MTVSACDFLFVNHSSARPPGAGVRFLGLSVAYFPWTAIFSSRFIPEDRAKDMPKKGSIFSRHDVRARHQVSSRRHINCSPFQRRKTFAWKEVGHVAESVAGNVGRV